MPPTRDTLHGTLDALVLKTLSWGPRHGYAVTRWIAETSGERIRIEEGSLYPALYRLERQGLISARWGTSELGRRARFYELTPAGRRQLREELEGFRSFVAAVAPILLTG